MFRPQWIYSWTLHNWWKLVDDRWIREQTNGTMGREAGVSSSSAAPLSPHHLHCTVHCLSIITSLRSSKTSRCCEATKSVSDSLHLSHTSTQLSPICYAIILSNCDSLRNKKWPVLEAQSSSPWWKSSSQDSLLWRIRTSSTRLMGFRSSFLKVSRKREVFQIGNQKGWKEWPYQKRSRKKLQTPGIIPDSPCSLWPWDWVLWLWPLSVMFLYQYSSFALVFEPLTINFRIESCFCQVEKSQPDLKKKK